MLSFNQTKFYPLAIEGLILAFIVYQMIQHMKVLLILLVFIIPNGKTVIERFKQPDGYQRLIPEANSFGEYLQNFPLKSANTKVYFFNDQEKTNAQHVAVLDIDRGTKDLQQCADAVMRLRAEYLYQEERFKEISFKNFQNVAMSYDKYRQGYRMTNNGFLKLKGADDSKDGFRKYLDMVFNYANTATLQRELINKNLKKIQIGDVFIVATRPYGHAMIVMDVAENSKTKDRVFLLAQSYMPAQDIHIVKNPKGGCWYSIKDIDDKLITPEWTFSGRDLYCF
jgi:hypothetical protein